MSSFRIRRRTFLALTLAACSDGVVSAFLPPIPGPLRRGPQLALVDGSSALVAFRTDYPAAGALEYGETAALGTRQTSGRGEEHAFSLTGLAPGTEYHYRIEIDGRFAGATHRFTTEHPDPDATMRFAVLGDGGTGLGAQLDVAARLAAWDPDLLLHTGDVIYEEGRPEELDPKYFLPYRDLIDHVPVYVSLGNHDTYFDGGRTLLDALYLPRNPVTMSEEFYSFDRGAVHFVALDSNSDLAPGSVQHDWLDADLAAADARFVVVFFHHPPYSSGPRDDNLELRAALGPLFDQHGVDLVLTGHDHLYHRSLPIHDGVVTDASQEPGYVDPGGTIYVVTGGGGRTLYESTTRSFTAYDESSFHFVGIEVIGPRLTLEVVRADGTTLDRMSVTKTTR